MPDEPSSTSPLSEESTQADSPPRGQSERIGAYKILERIGEGGMGIVYLAEQEAPLRRRVALKIIKPGMDSEQVLARFEAERQALAVMNHPAVAKVFDAGMTPQGLPYFVMEYVQGEPITTYCDRQRLTTRERMELFRQVCDGVQHAHQKGIIHRDLKPSNILVTVPGDAPVPKIIDFGVAKATAQRLTERSMFTELGVLIGTPEYMSPEQAEMTGVDVDTRTDVYALGVTLYELLTGALPFDARELRTAGFDEIRRRIRDVDPPRPSTRVGTLGDHATESARRRHTEPRKLVSALKGELDWITMKALEKDRTRRYASPNELSADIGRQLADEPVLAGPPSTVYRTRKFVRRHRVGVTAALLAAVALAGFSVTTAVQSQRIAKQRNLAQRVSGFLTDLFKVSDPSESRGNAITAREILDKGAERIEKELGSEPDVQAELMRTMGVVYLRLGLYPKAEPLLTRSVEIRRKRLGARHPDTLLSMSTLAVLYGNEGRYGDAEKLQAETLANRRAVLGKDHPDTLTSMNDLAVACARQDRYEEAEKLFRDVLEARRRVLGDHHPDTLWSMNNLAAMDDHRRRFDEAEKLYGEVVAIRSRTQGRDHPDTLWSMNNLSNVYGEQGRWAEAEKLDRETLDISRRVLGNDHPQTLDAMNNLAHACVILGHDDEAEKLLREMLDTSRRVLGNDHPNTLKFMNNMASLDSKRGRYDEAETLFKQTLEIQRRVLGDRHADTLDSLYNLGCVSALRKSPAKAIDWLRQATDRGYRNADALANDSDLASLKGDPAFEALVAAAKRNSATASR